MISAESLQRIEQSPGWRHRRVEVFDLPQGRLLVKGQRAPRGPWAHRWLNFLARAAGVYEAAIESVLADAPPPGAEALPALWWADQMRLRQHQLVSNTGQIPKVQRVPPPHPSAPRRRDPFEPEPAPSSRAPVHESGEIPREIDPDQAQLIHRRDRDRALDGAPPPADTRKKSRG